MIAACGSGAPTFADDVLAIMALLREPTVDVRAITLDGNGEAHCDPGMRDLTWLLTQFGAEGIPIGCGREEPGPHGRLFPSMDPEMSVTSPRPTRSTCSPTRSPPPRSQ